MDALTILKNIAMNHKAIKNKRVVFELLTDNNNGYAIRNIGQKKILAGSLNANQFLTTKSYKINTKTVNYQNVLEVVKNDYIELLL